jgi:hypothetical protein
MKDAIENKGSLENLEREIFEWAESVPRSEEGRTVSAVHISKPIIIALDTGEARPVARWMAEVENRLGDKRVTLDFKSCQGIQEMVRATCCRLLRVGREEEAKTLGQAFGRYFEVPKGKESEQVKGSQEKAFSAFAAANLLQAVKMENIQWAANRLAELERQLGERGVCLDFAGCKELEEAVSAAYGRSWINGDALTTRLLQRSFGMYFTLPSPKR